MSDSLPRRRAGQSAGHTSRVPGRWLLSPSGKAPCSARQPGLSAGQVTGRAWSWLETREFPISAFTKVCAGKPAAPLATHSTLTLAQATTGSPFRSSVRTKGALCVS